MEAMIGSMLGGGGGGGGQPSSPFDMGGKCWHAPRTLVSARPDIVSLPGPHYTSPSPREHVLVFLGRALGVDP